MKSTMTAGRILPGIPFAHLEEAGELLLDLYLPAGSQDFGPSPAVVYYDGGGWRTGCRSSLGPSVDTLGLSAIERLVEAGFVVASADYRLSSIAHFPAQLLDAKAAVRWLRAHAADYNVDPEQIYASGDSASGHLASLVALTAGSAKYRGDEDEYAEFSDSVAAVAAWDPPTDLLRMGEQALPDAVATADDPGSREALLLGPAGRGAGQGEGCKPAHLSGEITPTVLPGSRHRRPLCPAGTVRHAGRGAGSRGHQRRTSAY